jgi:flagellar basal-body rod protein FlgC
MTIAASGMSAAIASLTAAASNVANAQTTAPTPGAAPSPASVPQPVTVIETSLAEGGVSATVIRPTSSMLYYAPASAAAGAQGMVAVPNIDLATQMVNMASASLAFRANAKVFQIAARDQKTLLDIMA